MQTAWSETKAGSAAWLCLSPRAKLLGILAWLVATALVTQLPTALACLAMVVGCLLLARVPGLAVVERLPGVALFLGLLVLLPLTVSGEGWGPFSGRGAWLALLFSVKIIAALLWSLLLMAVCPGRQLLLAIQELGLPPRGVQLAMLTGRSIGLVREQLQQMRIALRLRSFRNRPAWASYLVVGRAVGTLLVRTHDRAERVGQAMQTRGYAGRPRLLSESHPGRAGWLWLAGSLLSSVGLLILDYLVGRG